MKVEIWEQTAGHGHVTNKTVVNIGLRSLFTIWCSVQQHQNFLFKSQQELLSWDCHLCFQLSV